MIINLKIKYLLLHLLITFCIFFIPFDYAPLPFIILFLIYFNSKRNVVGVLIVGIYSICCKSEAVYFVYGTCLFFYAFFDKRKILYNKEALTLQKKLFVLYIYIILLYFVQIVVNYNFLSLPFYAITFLSPILIMYYIWRANISSYEIITFFQQFLYISISQCFVVLFFQILPSGISNVDLIKGTTASADIFANVLLFSILPFFIGVLKNPQISFAKIFILFLSVIYLLFIYLCDAKTEILSVLMGGIVLLYCKLWWGKIKIIYKVFITVITLFSVLFFFNVIKAEIASIMFEYDDYITGSYNNKIQYYEYSFSPNTRPILQYIIGTGAGTNGSRAANALSYDVLYKTKNTAVRLPEFIEPNTSDFTKKYLAPLFSKSFAETIINRSALLGNPFNSISAMFVEVGIIGFILFFSVLYIIIKLLINRTDYLSLSALILLFSNIISAFIMPSFEQTTKFIIFMYVGFSLSAAEVNSRSK